MLVDHLRAQPAETAWLEFKHNNTDPDRIGRSISALANGACVECQPLGYMVWGIDDATHEIVGTEFEPELTRKGNDLLSFWLARHLTPSPAFSFKELLHPDGRIVILEINATNYVPIKFHDIAYIRIGSATPKLSDYPEREADLLNKLRPFAWENGIAKSFLTFDEITDLIDIDSYFSLIKSPTPSSQDLILSRLQDEKVIQKDIADRWSISNLGAILFARKLDQFEASARKALRVVTYDGTARVSTRRIQTGNKGYAAGFRGLLSYIETIIPSSETIGRDGVRNRDYVFPLISIRELVANALIHQDMTITGTGPLVEIFDNRIEISNPGKPVTDIVRKLFGAPPRSRNERMATLMRRMGLCEELGSGLVKIVDALEHSHLPGLDLAVVDDRFIAIMIGPLPFSEMTRQQRVQVCYQHACLRHQHRTLLTNSSLRARFGIEARNAAQVSRVIRDALDDGVIRIADPDHPKAGYTPYWA